MSTYFVFDTGGNICASDIYVSFKTRCVEFSIIFRKSLDEYNQTHNVQISVSFSYTLSTFDRDLILYGLTISELLYTENSSK